MKNGSGDVLCMHADLSVLDITSVIERIEALNLSGVGLSGTAIFKHRDI